MMSEIVFAGDGWGALAGLESMQEHFDAIAILTDDSEVRARARSCDRIVDAFEASTGRTVVCSGFGRLLPAEVLHRKDAFLNVHYSLLPKYRGHHATVWTILNGDTTHGITIHKMDERMDAGPILLQKGYACAGMNALEMMNACNALTRQWLGLCVRDFLRGQIEPQTQDEARATWGAKRNLDDCLVNFDATAIELERLFRALVPPYPRPMLRVSGELLEIASARVLQRSYVCTNGRVVNVDAAGAYIKIADGLLVVEAFSRGHDTVPPHAVLRVGQRL
jgi:methionyl-tRNA formyltransferase